MYTGSGTGDRVSPPRLQPGHRISRPQSSALVVPPWLDRLAGWAWRSLIIVLAALMLVWLVLQIRIALIPLLIAIVAATALRPLARRLEALRLPPWLAALVPLTAVIVIVTGACWFMYLRAHARLAADAMSGEEVRAGVEGWLRDGPLGLTSVQIESAEEAIRAWLVGGARSFGLEYATSLVTILGGAALTIVLTYLLVKDGANLYRSAVRKADPVRSRVLERAGIAAARTMAAYLHSVALTGVIDALLIGAGLWILGVPLVLPLMILTALAALFPIVGALLAGAAAAVVALVTVGPTTALWVVLLGLVVQQLEGNIVLPRIVGSRMSLHPAVVLVSLAAGGAVAGLAGAFLGVPLIAAATMAVREFSSGIQQERTEIQGVLEFDDLNQYRAIHVDE